MNQNWLSYRRFYSISRNHPFLGRIIETETSLEVVCIKIMTHPQVFGQKFTPIRRFLGRNLHPSAGFWASKSHPFWPLHIPSVTQYGSAPPLGTSPSLYYSINMTLFTFFHPKIPSRL